MGERKVLNKYYGPDFDPSKIPRIKNDKKQESSRMMLPMSIRCTTCGNYIYRGTKFNSPKEDVPDELYLGKIKVFRFYFKCTNCSAEIAIKTDPQNSDYVAESGTTRNFEPWRHVEDDNKKYNHDAVEDDDAMKILEGKRADSKREMDIMAALDESKSMKRRHENIGTDDLFQALQKQSPVVVVEEKNDEAFIKSLFEEKSRRVVRRINDDDVLNDNWESQTNKRKKGNETRDDPRGNLYRSSSSSAGGRINFVRKLKSEDREEKQKVKHVNSLQVLSQEYDDVDDDD